MPSRPFKRLTDNFLDICEEISRTPEGKYTSPELLLETLEGDPSTRDTMISEYLDAEDRGISLPSNQKWIRILNDSHNCYLQKERELNLLLNEESSINRIERRAHQRVVLYRGLTTLTVGLIIMGIYALAHYLELPMPLMRLPV